MLIAVDNTITHWSTRINQLLPSLHVRVFNYFMYIQNYKWTRCLHTFVLLNKKTTHVYSSLKKSLPTTSNIANTSTMDVNCLVERWYAHVGTNIFATRQLINVELVKYMVQIFFIVHNAHKSSDLMVNTSPKMHLNYFRWRCNPS